MLDRFDIGKKTVGEGSPTFVIAEAGANHNRDLDLARRLSEIAAEAGADAIKFQTYSGERIYSTKTPRPKHFEAFGTSRPRSYSRRSPCRATGSHCSLSTQRSEVSRSSPPRSIMRLGELLAAWGVGTLFLVGIAQLPSSGVGIALHLGLAAAVAMAGVTAFSWLKRRFGSGHASLDQAQPPPTTA